MQETFRVFSAFL